MKKLITGALTALTLATTLSVGATAAQADNWHGRGYYRGGGYYHGRGPGVGAVGMCLTGGFALAMMVDDVVVAPVLSQPSLPAAVLKRNRDDLGISAADLATVKRRSDEGVCVLGLRFTGDPMVPAARFERLERELGDNFIGVEIDSSEGNPWGYKAKAHSVLTEDYSDAEGSPTKIALEQVLDFFRERLDLV